MPTDNSIHLRPNEEQSYTRKMMSYRSSSRFLILITWSICYFAFYLLQQITEIVAPILLIIGIGWRALPYLINTITQLISSTDPQTHQIIHQVSSVIPHAFTIGNYHLTASSLIFDAILLMVLTAIMATITSLMGRRI